MDFPDLDGSVRYYKCSCGHEWYSAADSVSQKCRRTSRSGKVCGMAWTGELASRVPKLQLSSSEDGSLNITFKYGIDFSEDAVRDLLTEQLKEVFNHHLPTSKSEEENSDLFTVHWTHDEYYHNHGYAGHYGGAARQEKEPWGNFSQEQYDENVKERQESRDALGSSYACPSPDIRIQYEKKVATLDRKIKAAEKAAALILYINRCGERNEIAALMHGAVGFRVSVDRERRNVYISSDVEFEDHSSSEERFIDSAIKTARHINCGRPILSDEDSFRSTLIELIKLFRWSSLLSDRERTAHLTEECYICRFTLAHCMTSTCYGKGKYRKFNTQKLYIQNMYQDTPWTPEEEHERRMAIVAFFQEVGKQVDPARGVNMVTIRDPEYDIRFLHNGAFTVYFKDVLIARKVIEKLSKNRDDIAMKLNLMKKNWQNTNEDESVPGLLYLMTMRINSANVQRTAIKAIADKNADCVGQLYYEDHSKAALILNLFARPDVLKRKAAEIISFGELTAAFKSVDTEVTYKRVIEPMDVLNLEWTGVSTPKIPQGTVTPQSDGSIASSSAGLSSTASSRTRSSGKVEDLEALVPTQMIPDSGDHTFANMCKFFDSFCKLSNWSMMREFVDAKTGFGRCQAGAYERKKRSTTWKGRARLSHSIPEESTDAQGAQQTSMSSYLSSRSRTNFWS